MSRVRTQGAELGGAVGVRRGSRTAPGRAKGLEENGAGPSGGGGGGERGIFKHRGQGQARWAFIRSRPFEREDGAPVHLATTEARFMPD